MKLIVAQGNAEKRYDDTRHNVGFRVIDAFASSHDAVWLEKSKFQASIAELSINDEKVLLVKPTTFYNETGQSVRALLDFYKDLDQQKDILVLHDDLALPFGTLRVRAQGGDAGNNGIKSISSHIGPQYHRIRIGIHNEQHGQIDDISFVLGRFSKSEDEALNTVSEKAAELITQFVEKGLTADSITLALE